MAKPDDALHVLKHFDNATGGMAALSAQEDQENLKNGLTV